MEKILIATYERRRPDALRARIENALPPLDIFMDECVEQQPDDGPGTSIGNASDCRHPCAIWRTIPHVDCTFSG